MSEIQKMNLESENLVENRLDKLKALVPEVFTESGIDFDKLRLELGDEIDEGQERYAFTWPGKMDAIRQSQTVSTATLRPCVEKSRGRDGEDGSFDSDNIYIEGDNLEVLKLLQRGYHGKVKIVYIDPPYNTGGDFVYKDSFGQTIADYREQAGLTGQSNSKSDGRFHANWCSMIYPRLKLARELLKPDGILVASIDENERTNLQSLLNEVFGEQNFAGEIVWKNSSKNDQAYISMQHEYMLVYVKDKGSTPETGPSARRALKISMRPLKAFVPNTVMTGKLSTKPPSTGISNSRHLAPSTGASIIHGWMSEVSIFLITFRAQMTVSMCMTLFIP